MNQLVQPQEQIQAQLVVAQWVQYIVPIITGITGAIYAVGMVRDLVKGREVKLPTQK